MASLVVPACGAEAANMGLGNNDGSLRPKLQPSVSIVVDDVDGMEAVSPAGTVANEEEVFDDQMEARSDISNGSRGSTREESDARLQLIKEEIRMRRDGFAKLLDEHEQVVQELRRIESSGDLNTLGNEAEEDVNGDLPVLRAEPELEDQPTSAPAVLAE